MKRKSISRPKKKYNKCKNHQCGLHLSAMMMGMKKRKEEMTQHYLENITQTPSLKREYTNEHVEDIQ